MRKGFSVLLAGVFVVMFAGAALAGSYGDAGCGLGSMVFKNEPGLVQVFAATTNGTLGNQTFGITSGTSNCGSSRTAMNDRTYKFVNVNMDNLAREIAKGHGESLETLAELLQIPVDNRNAFYQKMQSNFSNIFTSEKVEVSAVMTSILTLIAS